MSADVGHPPGLRSPVVRHPSQALVAHSVADVLGRLAAIAKAFERACRQMVQAVMQRRLPTTLCTIPYPRFPEPELQRLAVTALTVFNDVSIREAFKAGIPPPWKTVYHYFRLWRLQGRWDTLHKALHAAVRVEAGRDPQPRAAILDS